MSAYAVVIEETLSQTFLVEAKFPEKAAELARARYRSGTYVLEPGEATDVRLCVEDKKEQLGTWERL